MAFVAVTVRIEELPEMIELGLAVMLAVGAGLTIPVTLPPHPETSRVSRRLDNSAAENNVRHDESGMRT